MTALTRAVGQSGRRYLVVTLLQEARGPMPPVYLAAADNQKYVLKSAGDNDAFHYYQRLFNDLRTCPYVRVADDEIPAQHMFAYKYMNGHLLSFVQKPNLPLSITKRVLRDALRGIATLHEKGIIHSDIKPNNIMLDWRENKDLVVEKVQIADIDDAAYVPEGHALIGRQLGNWMWRSPEAMASAACHKPTDIFSFAITCIYALTKRVILAVGDDELKEGEVKEAIVCERYLSYFSDLEGVDGLLTHLGDSPWVQIFTVIAEGFNAEFPRRPFSMWEGEGLEPVFKDLIVKMTNVDPEKRITAQEALEHQWFVDVP